MSSYKECCICGMRVNGSGYDPYPLKDSGRCCESCNVMVIRERLKRYLESKKLEESSDEV